MAVPNNVAPLKNSTLLIDPSASFAVAVIVIFAAVVKVLLAAGEVILTVGVTLATESFLQEVIPVNINAIASNLIV